MLDKQCQTSIRHFANNFKTNNDLQRKSLKVAKNKELHRCVYVWLIQ